MASLVAMAAGEQTRQLCMGNGKEISLGLTDVDAHLSYLFDDASPTV
jgi:hypothetical protein